MADLNFRLNAQGPRGPQGPQGEKGEDGITPLFYEGINNATTYTLNIDYGDGNVSSTGNLRPPTVNNGGTYVRYDNVNNVYSLTTPDYADLDHNPGEVILLNADDYTGGDPEELEGYAVSGQFITEVINTMNTEFTNVNNAIDLKADKATTYTKTETNTLLNGKANTVHTHTLSQITDAGSLAGKNTVNYNTDITNKPTLGTLAAKNTVDYVTEVTNKPTIPTVGNGTITINQGGTLKGTFTVNQNGNTTINLDAGSTYTLPIATTTTLGGVMVDGVTVTIDADGVISSTGGGTTYTAGDAIDLTSDTISVKVDGTTIGLNAANQLELKATIPDVSHMVTDNTTQTISGSKTFTAETHYQGNITFDSALGTPIIRGMSGASHRNMIVRSNTYSTVTAGNISDGLILKGNQTRPKYSNNSTDGNDLALYSDIPGDMTGAGASTAGVHGLVPAPAAGDNEKYLRGDGTWQTVSSGGPPANMVTTDTDQAITGSKTFNGSSAHIILANNAGIKHTWNNITYDVVSASGGDVALGNYLKTTSIYASTRPLISTPNNPTAYMAYTSDIKTAKKKTITQASANVSESAGTVTVTDSDVTTSTIVNLYPTDSTTETWLENNLSSTIITEGTGSFTFEISGSLPSTWSMYYTITEVI